MSSESVIDIAVTPLTLAPEQSRALDAFCAALRRVAAGEPGDPALVLALVQGLDVLGALASAESAPSAVSSTGWQAARQQLPGGALLLQCEDVAGEQRIALHLDEGGVPFSGEWDAEGEAPACASFRLEGTAAGWTLALETLDRTATLALGPASGLRWGAPPQGRALFAASQQNLSGLLGGLSARFADRRADDAASAPPAAQAPAAEPVAPAPAPAVAPAPPVAPVSPAPAPAPVVSAPAPAVAPVASAPPAGDWHCLAGGQQLGPLDDETLRRRFADGTLTAETLLWRPGMAEWQSAREAAPQLLPVSPDWYYLANGQQVGPVGEGDLRGWLREGRLPADCLVWTAALADWQPAWQLGLAPAPGPRFCGKCGARLIAGDRFCGACGQPAA